MALPTPDPRTYPDVHDCSTISSTMPTLEMDQIRDKPLLSGEADLLTSRENQFPLPKIVVDTSMVVNNDPTTACIGNTTPDSNFNLSHTPLTTTAANSSTSVYYTCSSPVQTAQGTANTSAGTYHYISGNAKDLRRVSLDKLRLGPLLEEGVSILVESDGIARSFLVHTKLLCHFSPFFHSIFAKKEPRVFTKDIKSLNYNNELDFDRSADEQVKEEDRIEVKIKVNMPTTTAYHSFRLPNTLGDVKHVEFAAFIDWLYLGYEKLEQMDDQRVLIRLWVLAGRLGIPSCQNDCISAIEHNRKRSRTISTSMIGWVYANTANYGKNKCGLRNMLIDQCALALDERSLLFEMQEPGFTEYFPKECFLDMVARLRVLLKESSLGAGSMTIDPRSRRYRNATEEGNTY